MNKPAHLRAPSGDGRVLALDGIRGLACLLVVVWHYASSLQYDAWPLPVRGLLRSLGLTWSGVDLFLVLSGFLLGGICLKHRQAANFFTVFYSRRFCRILPLYLVWLMLWLILPRLLDAAALHPVFRPDEPVWPYAAFVQNLFFTARGAYGPTWLAVTWSLAVEEQFYLILPALIRWIPARRLQGVLVVLILTGPLARAAVVFGLPPSHAMATYWLLPCRWDALFLGVLAALWTHDRQGEHWAGRHLPAIKLVLMCTAVVLAGVLVVAPDKKTPWTAILGYSVIDLFFVALVLVARFDTLWGRWFSLQPLVWLGSISFGVYVFHLGLLGLGLALLCGDACYVRDGMGLTVLVLTAAVTVGLAWLSYRFFEAPIVRLGRRWHYGRARVGQPAVSAAPSSAADFPAAGGDSDWQAAQDPGQNERIAVAS
jgi:peptidoglycan/LPS O-acetylase OafA/YrhL